MFVSYASEERTTAEAVVHSIRSRGHKAFFDRDGLPPGKTYEDQIEDAIGRADVFVFLVSTASLAPGSFTLTELQLAERKWPRPAGRVLPVMIAATDYANIPAYLKAVTVLEPRGNIAAETAAAVQAMRRLPIGKLTVGVGAAAVAIVLVNQQRITGGEVTNSVVSRLAPASGLKAPLTVPAARIVDLALQADVFVVIIENAQGARQTLALRYE